MNPTWLIETGVWKDDNVPRMIRHLADMDVTVHANPFTPFGGTEFEVVDADGPVVFYGSLNTADHLRVCGKRWVPLVWFDDETFCCRSYYAHWGKFLLQEQYAFYPLAELVRLKDDLYKAFGKEEKIFIRPDDNDKSFTGRLVPKNNFQDWYGELEAGRPNPAALVIVASPVSIEAEWRFVIADRQVITGSHYRWGDRLELSGNHQHAAARLAQQLALEPWQPRPIYCVDVACNRSGQYRLVEIGGINSAGLYHCDLLAVIQAMNVIAVRDYRAWKGTG